MQVCLCKDQGLSLVRPLCRSVSSARVGSRRCPTQSYIRQNFTVCKSSSGGGAFCDLALINVDYISPSLWLGVVLGITGMILYSLKFRDAKGTTEADIVAASLFVMCGGILTLQGWRLDPILMLSEFVLGGVGIFYMVQTVNLRKQLEMLEESEQEPKRTRRWSLPRQRAYGGSSEYDRLPEGSYREYSDTFQPRLRAKGYDSADYGPSTDSAWPRTPGRDSVRSAPTAPREEMWVDEQDTPYGVDTTSPKGRVSPEFWDRRIP